MNEIMDMFVQILKVFPRTRPIVSCFIFQTPGTGCRGDLEGHLIRHYHKLLKVSENFAGDFQWGQDFNHGAFGLL